MRSSVVARVLLLLSGLLLSNCVRVGRETQQAGSAFFSSSSATAEALGQMIEEEAARFFERKGLSLRGRQMSSAGCPAPVLAAGPTHRTPVENCSLTTASKEVATMNCLARSKAKMCAFPVQGIPGLAGKDPQLIDSAVVNADQELFQAKVLEDRGGSVWIVEYYADWCPHCQAFAPKWQRLAVALRESNADLHLVSVNCEVHGKLCNERKVRGYPTMEWFYSGQDAAIRSSLTGFYMDTIKAQQEQRRELIKRTVEAVREQGDSITEEQAENVLMMRGYLGPPEEPEPLDHSGVLSANLPHTANCAELLDFCRVLPGSHSAPPVALENALLESDDGPTLNCPPERSVPGDIFPNSGWPQDELEATAQTRLADASFMVGYTLRNWMTPRPGRNKDMGAFDQQDLVGMAKWLQGLSANFPVAQKELKDLLELVEAAKGYAKDLCVGDWLTSVEAAEAVLGTSPPSAAGSCKTDTCRVWTLFHFLSLAERRGHDGALSAQETLDSIEAFITNSFRCEHCRKHALEQLGAGAYGRDEMIAQGAEGFPIYLWRFHNAVSVRIAAEGSCPGDRRWPPPDLCPACWEKSDQEWDVLFEAKQIFSERRGGALDATGAVPVEAEVLKFLDKAFQI